MSDIGDSDFSPDDITPQAVQAPDISPSVSINPDDPSFQMPSIMGGVDFSGGDLPVQGSASSDDDLWSSYIGQKEAEIAANVGQAADNAVANSSLMPNGWNYETIQAAFDPTRSNGKTAVFTPDGLGAVYQNQDQVQVTPYAKSEKLGFLVPNTSGGLDYVTPSDLKTYGTSTSDNASATPPAGAVYGMHGHIPSVDNGMIDNPDSNGGYGDAQSLNRASPLPMATIARTGDGNYAVGLHEIVNGQLQFRAPIGSLTDAQRQAIQANLDQEQKKFYN